MSKLKIVDRPPESLKPRPGNPRTHNRRQIRQIKASIRRFGFCNPILIDDNNSVVAGHGRLKAAKNLNLETVPTIRLSSLSEGELKAYALADNRLAQLAGWDDVLLTKELQYIVDLDIQFDIQPTVTGFDWPEIEAIIFDGDAENVSADDIQGCLHDGPTITQVGDLWIIGGSHRLLCADATCAKSFAALMAGAFARLVFTDPPYNVRIRGNVSGLGRKKHGEFVMASGEMNADDYLAFLHSFINAVVAVSIDGALHYICIDWRHVHDLLSAGQDVYSKLINICVWNKDNGGMGSLYRSKHELIAVFKSGPAPHLNNVQLGKYGRNRTNIWDYPGVCSLGADRQAALAMHPTVKPVTMVADAILDASERGDIVLDPFVGSGTTIMAAERTGRRCYAMELDRRYVDVAIRRYRQHTGQTAVLASTGQTFDEIEAEYAELLGDT